MHPFDRAIELAPEGGVVRGRTQPEWANMVGPFGGITAAIVVRAIELQPDCLGEPVALTINFAAPMADGDFEIACRAPRTNRTNQHWIAEISQNGVVTTTATAVFGIPRDTWSDTEAVLAPVPAPEQLDRSINEALPDWVRLYDMRFTEGGVFGATGQPGSSSSTTTLWVRDVARRGIDYPALAALSDVFIPRIFLRRGVVPAGTISMTTYFHADPGELQVVGDDFVLGIAQANRFHDGFFDQSAQLWGRSGALLATSHQMVYFKG